MHRARVVEKSVSLSVSNFTEEAEDHQNKREAASGCASWFEEEDEEGQSQETKLEVPMSGPCLTLAQQQ